MLLLFSTDKFQIHGVIYPGFPILLDTNMSIVEPAHCFLLHQCIQRGRLNSKKSWQVVGQNIYDYFSFLEAHNLKWDQFDYNKDHSIIAAYRDWSIKACGLKSSTVNQRLRTLVTFYNYAHRQSWINNVPYDLESVYVRKGKGFLAHTDTSGGRVMTPNVMLRELKTPIKLLSIAQVKVLLETIKNPTHKLMVRLALQTGLRKEEIATFPKKYILNPTVRKDIKNIVVVELDPQDMRTKGSKSRAIHVPRLLMEDLWQYVIHERNQLESITGEHQNVLFLSRYGKSLAENGKSFGKILNDLNLDFHVTPHILRHTYSTHTLYGMRKRKSHSDPLMYVRDRLGHASIATTQVYLHCVEEVEGDLMTAILGELKRLMFSRFLGDFKIIFSYNTLCSSE